MTANIGAGAPQTIRDERRKTSGAEALARGMAETVEATLYLYDQGEGF